MFNLRRKIGAGATSRRRPPRGCKVGIESLDSRVVPATTSMIGAVNLGTMVVSDTTGVDQSTFNTVPVTVPVTSTQVPSVQDPTILAIAQSTGTPSVFATTNAANTETTISATDVPVNIAFLDSHASQQFTSGFLTLNATSTSAATMAGSNLQQSYTGTFSVFSGPNKTGTNILSGTFTDTIFGGGTSLTLSVSNATPPELVAFTSDVLPQSVLQNPLGISLSFINVTPSAAIVGSTIAPFNATVTGNFSANVVTPPTPPGPGTLGPPTPGSPIVESGLNANLSVSADEFGHGTAALTTTNPFLGTSSTAQSQLLTNLVGNTLTNVPGVTGTGTPNPLTLAYRLPTTVFPGDVVVRHFQTGQVSDLIRFVNAFNPTTGSFNGWMLFYSDNTPETDGTAENAPADVGIPTPNVTLATRSASEIGAEGFDIIDYQPEQAIYSLLSDGNLISSTGA